MRENQYGLCTYALTKTELKITVRYDFFLSFYNSPNLFGVIIVRGRANKIDKTV